MGRGHLLAERTSVEAMAMTVKGIPSSASSKRRARKKRNLALHKGSVDRVSVTCPVCDGTGMLLADPCPLCADEDADGEEEPEQSLIPDPAMAKMAAAVAETSPKIFTSADTPPMSTDLEPTSVAYSTENPSDSQEEARTLFLKAGASLDVSSVAAAESEKEARVERASGAGGHLQKLRRCRAEGGAEKLHHREQVYGVFAAGFKIVVKNTFLVIEPVPTSTPQRRRRSHSFA